MIRASIDLGTNTCLLLVKEDTPAGEKILHDESNVVRLGEGVASKGQLNPEAMKRTEECLANYAKIAGRFGVKTADIVAVATAQARNAGNAAPFFEGLKSRYGFQFRVLSGDEEAKATLMGAALPQVPSHLTVVMDIGGGSTELAAFDAGSKALMGKSLEMGAVKLTELFLKSDPVTDDQFWACEKAIDQMLEEMKPWRDSLRAKLGGDPKLVAVAGTAVTLAMLQLGSDTYDRNEIDGFNISRGDAHRIVEELKWRSFEERKKMPGMEVKRADVILAGAMIFWRVMEVLSFREVYISTRGLRYGVLKLF